MKRPILSRRLAFVILLASLFLVTGVVAAGEAIQRFAVVSGGSVGAQAGGYRLSGAVGQPVAGSVHTSDNRLRLCSGFWCGGTLSSAGGTIYLPVAMRNWPPYTIVEDAADACQSATAIEVGQLYRDDIEAHGDLDYFSFHAAAGSTYTLDMDNTNLNLYLISASCSAYLQSDTEGQRQIVWTNTLGEGDYRILIQEPGTNPGEVYLLQVTKNP
ncbi:MAG: hypothetical protein ACOYYS_00250 [Chloroflexota bacterium]